MFRGNQSISSCVDRVAQLGAGHEGDADEHPGRGTLAYKPDWKVLLQPKEVDVTCGWQARGTTMDSRAAQKQLQSVRSIALFSFW
jgi:hypothetical protein